MEKVGSQPSREIDLLGVWSCQEYEEGEMSEKVEKKIRKIAERAAAINIYKTYVGLIESIMKLPWKKRIKFSFCLIFKRQYR